MSSVCLVSNIPFVLGWKFPPFGELAFCHWPGPSSGAPVCFRQSLSFLGRQIFFSLRLLALDCLLFFQLSGCVCVALLLGHCSGSLSFVSLLSLIQLLGRESYNLFWIFLLPVDLSSYRFSCRVLRGISSTDLSSLVQLCLGSSADF